MRLLADENFPRPAIAALRKAGLDVISVAETTAGAADDEILAHCIATDRTLLTLDKDFGELAYHRGFRHVAESSSSGSSPRVLRKWRH